MNNTIAYVTNIKTGETTRYTNFTFDHVIKRKGNYYGIKSDGIYLLSGADDAGTEIVAKARTAQHDYGTANYKRVPYLFIDTDDATTTTPYINGAAQVPYQSGYNGRRTKLGRGLQGRYWGFEFSNIAGASMRIKGVEIELEVMSRKIS